MIGKRDRALLCLGFAGAFRRSELCALEVANLTEVPDGLRICSATIRMRGVTILFVAAHGSLIRRSKGDQEGQGQGVAIPRGYRLRPVEAVQAWLAAAEISEPYPRGAAIDDPGRAVVSERRVRNRAAQGHRSKHRPAAILRPTPAPVCVRAS